MNCGISNCRTFFFKGSTLNVHFSSFLIHPIILLSIVIIPRCICQYLFYNSFLMSHDREVAKEVKVEYINTMSKVYYSYFKAYGGKLTRLQVNKYNSTSTASSLMFNSISNVANNTAISTSINSGTRVGLFGLGDRALRVLSNSNLESAIILPHVASNAEYPIEVLFRSIHYALLDTVCREYYFLSDFFLLSTTSIMSRSLNWIQKYTETFVISSCSHDAIGLLICLQLLHAMLLFISYTLVYIGWLIICVSDRTSLIVSFPYDADFPYLF
ncbi:unnamed protein product [Trichobilharzia regenti]|nr:unnamed protein product [Trichobilharzia regenti]